MGAFTGPRASRSQIRAWRDALTQWSPREAFFAIVEEMAETLGDRAIDQPGVPFRDAWIASRFGALSHAAQVRLGADPPDFELMHGSAVSSFEATEILRPGRNRGDELNIERQRSDLERSAIEHVPGDEWITALEAKNAIKAAAEAKASKSYSQGTVLAIYLDVGFIADERLLTIQLAEAVAPAFPTFSSVWLLASHQLHRFDNR